MTFVVAKSIDPSCIGAAEEICAFINARPENAGPLSIRHIAKLLRVEHALQWRKFQSARLNVTSLPMAGQKIAALTEHHPNHVLLYYKIMLVTAAFIRSTNNAPVRTVSEYLKARLDADHVDASIALSPALDWYAL